MRNAQVGDMFFCDRASLYLIKVQNMDRHSSEKEFKCGSSCVNGSGSVSDWKCGLAGGVCQYRQERRSCRWTSLAPAFTLTFTATPRPLSLASASLVTFTSYFPFKSSRIIFPTWVCFGQSSIKYIIGSNNKADLTDFTVASSISRWCYLSWSSRWL